ncbi:MAG: glutathione S-transferase [Paracoccaceae bacterium]
MPAHEPYRLAIGDRAYSSWSLRGWLLFAAFGIPVRCERARLYTDALPQLLQAYAPARTVPAMRTPEGTVVSESLAIAEELASRHPEAGIWPAAPAHRAVARALAAEMHAGFGALRSHCAMNLRVAYTDCAPPPAVLADLARIESIWSWARAETASSGPWLCGAYSAADAFFAPVAARIAGHSLPVSDAAMAYVAAHLAHPDFRRWRAMGMADGPDQAAYARDWPRKVWPVAAPLAARAVDAGPSVNTICPYSGDPVTHFMEAGGRVWGFCNAFCRDKTVADPEAWPAFMAIYHS